VDREEEGWKRGGTKRLVVKLLYERPLKHPWSNNPWTRRMPSIHEANAIP
jgi:hypothetical protein